MADGRQRKLVRFESVNQQGFPRRKFARLGKMDAQSPGRLVEDPSEDVPLGAVNRQQLLTGGGSVSRPATLLDHGDSLRLDQATSRRRGDTNY